SSAQTLEPQHCPLLASRVVQRGEMPHIESEVKLDFKDVLIRPKRSFLSSRQQVSIERSFTFPASKQTWSGVPIIAANMDTIGTFEVAEVLAKRKVMCAVHKHYSKA
ncbi:unnamed protein product, partial [Prorocentrum cordatum]